MSAPRLAVAVAYAGGLGLIPKAPGVAASIAGLAFAVVLDAWGGTALLVFGGLALLAAGVWACDAVLKASAEGLIAVERDNLAIRELAGQVLALVVAPMSPAGLLITFGAFQLFSLARPWPTPSLSLPRGAVVMLDGVLAALASILIVGLMTWVLGTA